MSEPRDGPLGHLDIIDCIIDICEAEKSYRSIVLLVLMSKHHHAIVKVRLECIKKRVVLDLDEFEWRNKENDKNVDIIICTPCTLFTIDTQEPDHTRLEAQRREIADRVKRSMIVCRGRPTENLPLIWTMLFPSAGYFIVSEDSRHYRLMDISYALPFAGEAHVDTLKGYKAIFGAVQQAYEDVPQPEDDWDYQLRRLTIRYRLHRAYHQLLPDCPGQRFYELRGMMVGRDVAESSPWFHSSEELEIGSLVEECVSNWFGHEYSVDTEWP